MLGVNEDAYWQNYQRRVERWDYENEDGDVNDDDLAGEYDAWDCADSAFEEERLAKNRSV